MTTPNMRWVLTYRDRHGNVSMMEAHQGRNTYATEAEARSQLAAIMANNSRDTIASIWGEQAIESFDVREVECWPGHNDPKGCVYA